MVSSCLICRLRSQDGWTRFFEQLFRQTISNRLSEDSKMRRDDLESSFQKLRWNHMNEMDDIIDLLWEKCFLKVSVIGFPWHSVGIPMTIIWSILNWFISSILDLNQNWMGNFQADFRWTISIFSSSMVKMRRDNIKKSQSSVRPMSSYRWMIANPIIYIKFRKLIWKVKLFNDYYKSSK